MIEHFVASLVASQHGIVVFTADVQNPEDKIIDWGQAPSPSHRLGTPLIGTIRLLLTNMSAELPEDTVQITLKCYDIEGFIGVISLTGKFFTTEDEWTVLDIISLD